MKEKIKKVEDQINIIWNEVVNDLCNNTGVYSSEKSVVFNFALKFSKWAENHKHSNIRFDFERDMFKKDFSGGKFLDLYIEYDEVKIGLEFKYPKSTEKGGSNRKQVRIKSVNDIKRICFLVNKRKVDIGVFLLVTNEIAYTENRLYRIGKDYLIYNGVCYEHSKYLPNNEPESSEKVKPPSEICINWSKVNNLFSIKPIVVTTANANVQ